MGNAFLLNDRNAGIIGEKRANLLVFTIRQGSGREIGKERANPLVFNDTAGPRQGIQKEARNTYDRSAEIDDR